MQSLVGTWKLLEARAFDDAGHELPQPLGLHPMGITVFEAERMIGVVADGRTWLPADAPPRAFIAATINLMGQNSSPTPTAPPTRR